MWCWSTTMCVVLVYNDDEGRRAGKQASRQAGNLKQGKGASFTKSGPVRQLGRAESSRAEQER